MSESDTYTIVRFYKEDDERNQTIIATGVTLEEAKEHCNDPETSSETATNAWARKHTEKYGPWFDGWRKE